jgi:hypothetical protein
MNDELRERLQHLADAGADGIELTRPETAGRTRPRWSGAPALTIGAAAAALIVIVAGAVLVTNGGGNDPAVVARDGRASFDHDAVVAVTYGYASEVVTTPQVDLKLRFLDADGDVFAERSWDEALVPSPGGQPGQVAVLGGLLQDVPAGDLRLEATLQSADGPSSCTQPFTAATGDQLILDLQIGTDPGSGGDPLCAPVESVAEWAHGRTSGPIGEAYVGLPEAEAEAKADSAGLATRVVANDGMGLAITSDLRCDRLDLMVFDGVVVAADLPQESMPDVCGSLQPTADRLEPWP